MYLIGREVHVWSLLKGVMGVKKTKQIIMNKLKDAKKFSVIINSTPDLSHIDQITITFRFVNEKGNVIEQFVDFELISCHIGESLCDCHHNSKRPWLVYLKL